MRCVSCHVSLRTAMKIALLAVMCCISQQRCVAGYNFTFTRGGPYAEGMYESAQYYNSHGNSPDQYAMVLVGALNASGVPLIVELPQADRDAPMFSSSALPEVDNDFVTAMHWALEDGAYHAFGYICMGSISYDPIPNGGEGALGQGNCASAIEDVIDTETWKRLAVLLKRTG